MSRSITPSRVGGGRPPFNSSTAVQGRSTTPTGQQGRRTQSPTVGSNVRRRADGPTTTSTLQQIQPNVHFQRQQSTRAPPSQQQQGGMEPASNINVLVSDLVNISNHLKHYVSEHPNASFSQQGGQNAALKAEEIERIVRRVELHYQEKTTAVVSELEGHYQKKIAELEATVQEQKELIVQLTKDAQRRQHSSAPSHHHDAAALTDPIRQGISLRSQALSDLERSWECDSNSRPSSARDGELHQLRNILLAEKRQRLLVEEQTQSLTEQHSKVVNTLESRIRKQEKQVQQLMETLEFQSVPSTSDYNDVKGTPRSSKFRQRQAIMSNKANGDNDTPRTVRTNTNSGTPRDSLIEVGLSSSRDSSPVGGMQLMMMPRAGSMPFGSTPPPPVIPSQEEDAPSSSAVVVDDVTEFLDNISKELESISNAEEQRKSKIALLA